MSIKLAVLKSGENVISDAKELIVEDKVCGYLFNKPHKVEFSKSSLLLEGNITPISSDTFPSSYSNVSKSAKWDDWNTSLNVW